LFLPSDSPALKFVKSSHSYLSFEDDLEVEVDEVESLDPEEPQEIKTKLNSR
jgi:hypothetical protein